MMVRIKNVRVPFLFRTAHPARLIGDRQRQAEISVRSHSLVFARRRNDRHFEGRDLIGDQFQFFAHDKLLT